MRLKEGNKELDILNASKAVFAKVGYDKAKIAKIAEVANIATGSVYLYFENKEEILLRLLFDLWNGIYESSLEIISKNLPAKESLDRIIKSSIEILVEDLNMAQIYGNEQNLWIVRKKGKFRMKYYHWLDLLEKLFEDGVKSGDFAAKIESGYTVNFIIGGIRNLVHKWSLEEENGDKEKLVLSTIQLVHKTIF